MTDSGSDSSNPKVKILLVDHQAVNLLALEAMLQDLGQTLIPARSGAVAMDLLRDNDFAVILLDLQTLGLDGFETARLIRSRERSRHTPIIFLATWENTEDTVVKAYALGAVDYLNKPLTPQVVRAKVAGFVDLFQKTQRVKLQAEQFAR
jgi:CheY-like chemotaxis protein